MLECDGRHLYVTDNRRHRISKRSLQGVEVPHVHTCTCTHACTHACMMLALMPAHMPAHTHARTFMPASCLRECARTVQVGFATLPEVLEHAAGAIHLALGSDAQGKHELFVSQVAVARSP